MRDRIEKRRAELAAEMDKGQRIINDLQARLARAHEEMARLDGAVQVLGELLAGVPADMPAETGEPEPAAARGTEMPWRALPFGALSRWRDCYYVKLNERSARYEPHLTASHRTATSPAGCKAQVVKTPDPAPWLNGHAAPIVHFEPDVLHVLVATVAPTQIADLRREGETFEIWERLAAHSKPARVTWKRGVASETLIIPRWLYDLKRVGGPEDWLWPLAEHMWEVGCRAGMSVDGLRLRLEGVAEDKIAEALAPAGPYLEVRREGSRKYDRVPLPTEPGAALKVGADPGSGSGLVLEGLAPMHAVIQRGYASARYSALEVKGGGGTVYVDDELIHTDAGDGAAELREGSIVKLEYATTYTLTLRNAGAA